MCISALGLNSIANPHSGDIQVIGIDGAKKLYDPKFVLSMIDSLCQDLSDEYKIEQLYSRIEASIYGGITEKELIIKTLDAASFYAKYDKEFKVVSKKLTRQLTPKVNALKDDYTPPKMQGFSSIKLTS